jgi:hypothetical protein
MLFHIGHVTDAILGVEARHLDEAVRALQAAHTHIQSVSRAQGINAGGHFLGLFVIKKVHINMWPILDDYGDMTAFSFLYTPSCEPRLSSERPRYIDT